MLKQFIILPKRPKMSPGKLVSQGVHAAFMALEQQKDEVTDEFVVNRLIDDWKFSGQCVIVLQCKDQCELMQIAKYLEQWHVPNWLYIDEGYTETPALTATALATGVLDDELYGWMFKKLVLYK